MDDYNFWQDFFDTYQSLSDWMKFAWLVVPPAFTLVLIALVMRYRIASRRADRIIDSELVYSVYHDENDDLRTYGHNDPNLPNETRSPIGLERRNTIRKGEVLLDNER